MQSGKSFKGLCTEGVGRFEEGERDNGQREVTRRMEETDHSSNPTRCLEGKRKKKNSPIYGLKESGVPWGKSSQLAERRMGGERALPRAGCESHDMVETFGGWGAGCGRLVG